MSQPSLPGTRWILRPAGFELGDPKPDDQCGWSDRLTQGRVCRAALEDVAGQVSCPGLADGKRANRRSRSFLTAWSLPGGVGLPAATI